MGKEFILEKAVLRLQSILVSTSSNAPLLQQHYLIYFTGPDTKRFPVISVFSPPFSVICASFSPFSRHLHFLSTGWLLVISASSSQFPRHFRHFLTSLLFPAVPYHFPFISSLLYFTNVRFTRFHIDSLLFPWLIPALSLHPLLHLSNVRVEYAELKWQILINWGLKSLES